MERKVKKKLKLGDRHVISILARYPHVPYLICSGAQAPGNAAAVPLMAGPHVRVERVFCHLGIIFHGKC